MATVTSTAAIAYNFSMFRSNSIYYLTQSLLSLGTDIEQTPKSSYPESTHLPYSSAVYTDYGMSWFR